MTIIVLILVCIWFIWLIRGVKRSIAYQRVEQYDKVIENNLYIATGNIIFVAIARIVYAVFL